MVALVLRPGRIVLSDQIVMPAYKHSVWSSELYPDPAQDLKNTKAKPEGISWVLQSRALQSRASQSCSSAPSRSRGRFASRFCLLCGMAGSENSHPPSWHWDVSFFPV